MMMKRFLTGAAVCALSTAAMAADLPARKSAVAPVVAANPFSWTGFYVGGQLGWAGSHLSVSGENEGTAFNGSQSLNSYLLGGFAGYDYQIGSLVVGIEADANARTSSKTGEASFNWYYGPVTWKSESTWDASLRLRLGLLATNQTLIYATGGFAWANYKFRLNDAEGLLTENKTRTGWTIGAGLQQALTKNVSLRGEYRYTDYGSKSGTYDNGKGVGSNIDPYKSKLNDNRATVGLAYKF